MKIKGSGTYKDSNGRSHSVIGVGEVADDEKLRKLEVAGNLTFDKISCDKISVAGKCEGDSVSAQILKVSGLCEIDFVTADEILIASRSGFLGNVKCRKIKIDGGFAPVKFCSRVRIKNIEAEVVALENCEVDVIRCKDAIIDSNCTIKKLFFASKCEVAADSTVEEMIHT